MLQEKMLIILDLDETLIHATDKPHDENWHHEVFGYKVYRRPHLEKFLNGLRAHFDVAVWSSASDDYVEKVVAHIFPSDHDLKFVWGRSRCTYKPDYAKAEELGFFDAYAHYDHIKKLDKVFAKFPYEKGRVLIVDDTPRKAMYNFGNAIYPVEFKGETDDDWLLHLLEYLVSLKDVEDVRKVEKRGWRQYK